jgi:UbiA prenyltransferase family protein
VRAPLKASGWWNYKIPPMLAVAYYAVASAPHPPRISALLAAIGTYLAAVVGIAGFGHVYLDAFDVEEDRVLGKTNLWTPLRTPARFAIIALLLLLSWLPWLALPIGRGGVALIAMEFALFILYATPPIRLKDRGMFGITADALYAHVVPSLWTWIVFSRLSGSVASAWFLVGLVTWTLTVGMRHLLQHQVIQFQSDSVAGARTFAVRHGREKTLRLIVRGILPAEIVAFAMLMMVMSRAAPLAGIGFGIFAAWQLLKIRFLWVGRFNVMGRLADADRATMAGTLIMSRYYERWLPLLILVSVAIQDHAYVLLLLSHVLAFPEGITRLIREDLPIARQAIFSLLAPSPVARS